MDTALPQKFPFILDRNLAKANYTEDHVCTSCDTAVIVFYPSTDRVLHNHFCIAFRLPSYIFNKNFVSCRTTSGGQRMTGTNSTGWQAKWTSPRLLVRGVKSTSTSNCTPNTPSSTSDTAQLLNRISNGFSNTPKR